MKKIIRTSQYDEIMQQRNTQPVLNEEIVQEREKQPQALSTAVKREANMILDRFGKQYWPAIPINAMIDQLRSLEIELANEDGTPFEAIFTGQEGKTNIDLTWMGNPVINSVLTMTWYKMPSGNYEIVAYMG